MRSPLEGATTYNLPDYIATLLSEAKVEGYEIRDGKNNSSIVYLKGEDKFENCDKCGMLYRTEEEASTCSCRIL